MTSDHALAQAVISKPWLTVLEVPLRSNANDGREVLTSVLQKLYASTLGTAMAYMNPTKATRGVQRKYFQRFFIYSVERIIC
jgi:hypothetical protein